MHLYVRLLISQLTVEDYVHVMTQLVNDDRFKLFNICYKRIVIAWIILGFVILLSILFFTSGKQLELFGAGIAWLLLNAGAIFLCMWIKIRVSPTSVWYVILYYYIAVIHNNTILVNNNCMLISGNIYLIDNIWYKYYPNWYKINSTFTIITNDILTNSYATTLTIWPTNIVLRLLLTVVCSWTEAWSAVWPASTCSWWSTKSSSGWMTGASCPATRSTSASYILTPTSAL